MEWETYAGECDENNIQTKGMKIKVDGQCWQHVHPDTFNVYDMVNIHKGKADKTRILK